MAKAVYINIDESTKEVSTLQKDIMLFVDVWVKKHNTPVPKREIVRHMLEAGAKDFKTDHALNLLLRKGYIRRAVTISNKTSYVQMKSLIHV